MTRPSTKSTSTPKPGITMKEVLSGTVPLINGQPVVEASICDIHAVYNKMVSEWNSVTRTGRKMHGMTTASFYTMFRLARNLGLVEFVREEPMLHPPSKNLYSIRKVSSGDVRAVVSRRRI